MNLVNSQKLFEASKQVIPGGVNSPVRAFNNVGGTPPFIRNARGAYLYDEDGNRYIDYVGSWGPMILGHAYAPVSEAVKKAIDDSASFGAPTRKEKDMASFITGIVPGIEMIRMVNSGTEACMSAIRLARGYTGRDKFIKFEGCYHGHADMFLVQAGSGVATFDIRKVAGVPAAVTNDTLIAPYNDLEKVNALVRENEGEIAAVIIEPVAGNMGCVLPEKGFLEGLRELCSRHHILLIFDEVMTGFRLSKGGAQEYFGIQADLLTFGKIIGAGMPVGAFAGPEKIMRHIAPLGGVYQAGTLSGNPVAMTAGYTLLQALDQHPETYRELTEKTGYLVEGLKNVLARNNMEARINHCGSMMSVFFTGKPVKDFESASASDKERFKQFFHKMLAAGIYLPPSPFESWFLSNALTRDDLDTTICAAEAACAEL